MAETALYSVGTWDTEVQAYTPQTDPAFNLTASQLRQALKELRRLGYTCHRVRSKGGGHDNNDWAVLVERTDGAPEAQILTSWER